MVGDSAKDLGAAANAGIDSILVYPEAHAAYYDLDVLRRFKPSYVCASVREAKVVVLGESDGASQPGSRERCGKRRAPGST